MRRVISVLVALVLLLPTYSGGQGVMPAPKFYATDASGSGTPCAACALHTYTAGTTTNLTTYSDSALTVANANPIILDAGGRATVYLSANTYKFVLKDSTDTTTIWTQDNVSATAAFSVATDIAVTAGVTLTAGQVVYLSDGSGGLTAGRWYLADANFTYASSLATSIGMVPTTIASGASGSVRLVGRLTGLSGLVAGTTYYVSLTPGALTATAPTNVRAVGSADSTTSLVENQFNPNVALLSANNTFTGANVFSSATGQSMKQLLLPGSSSGTLTVLAAAAAGTNTLRLPAGTTDFSATGGTSFVLKQTSTGGALTVAQLASTDLSDVTSLATLTGTQTLTNKYLTLTAAPSNTVGTGAMVPLTYDASLTISNVVYVKTDGGVDKASATDNTKLAFGLALATAASGTNNVLLCGVYRDDSITFGTVGGLVYLGTSAGSMTQTQPNATDNVIQVLGTAIASHILYFCPSRDYVTHI